MHFAKYWSMGSSGQFKCWRSSDVSQSDAEARANADARSIALRLSSGALWKYGYPDRAVREEVLRQAPDAGGEISWAVTRNAYGCEVLNTSRMVFVDVDDESGASQRHLDGARNWTQHHAGWSFRVYRTKAGLRLLERERVRLHVPAV